MTVWIIEPHDPLIVRDGRPFGPNPGNRANSLPFPFPSTTTGGVRTRAGLKDGEFDKNNTQEVKKIKVRGPLLVQLQPDTNNDEPEEWLVPAPLDVLLIDDEQTKQTICRQLVPLELLENMQTNLADLTSVGLPEPDPRKPTKNAPQYWYWKKFSDWLLHPDSSNGQPVELSALGHNGPQREHRTHVSIDADQLIGKDGALFGTSGLEFTHSKQHGLSEAKRLALAVAVDNTTELTMLEGLTSFGGERRIVSWRESNSDLPQCPEELVKAIIQQRACRVLLLTPAHFKQGYRPTWLLEQKNGVKAHLQAIAIQHPQIVSGWDLENHKPKPTRRLAPAGTVLFLTLEGNDEAIAIRNWIKDIWMQCISDDERDQNDGFGLAVLGAWSGKPEKMH